MGMYSWKCKGCGHELIEKEDVRLNGQRQEYDGYGGSTEGFDVSAWHNRCYQKASKDERLDDSESPHAPNQGFGPSKLEFYREFSETASTTYTAVVLADFYEDGKSQRFEFYFTNNDKLEDEREYRIRQAELEAEDKIPFAAVDDWENWKQLTEEAKNKLCEEHQLVLDEAMGGKAPSRNAKVFSTINEAIAAVESILAESLPVKVKGNYELTVYGKQDKIEGCVYNRSVYDGKTKEYRIGDIVNDFDERLSRAVKRFEKIEAELKSASDALARLCQPVVEKSTLKELHELVEKLPQRWSDVRRIYEKIIVLEKQSNRKNKKMSSSRGCLILEVEPQKWFAVVALDEYDYSFDSCESFGPCSTASDCMKLMHKNTSNPGGSRTVSYDQLDADDISAFKRSYKNSL